MHWVWHVAPIERGLVAAVSVSLTQFVIICISQMKD